MPRAKNRNEERDWRMAAELCLTTALDRLREISQTESEPKQLEAIVKTVGDIVGVAGYAGSGRSSVATGGDSDDD